VDVALPSFILGYHGCDADLAEQVVAGKQILAPSTNDYDWLGPGIYFWEHNARRAFDFAKEVAVRPHPSQQKIKTPAAVGAIINLGLCLNLLDSQCIDMVREAHDDLLASLSATHQKMPQNTLGPDLIKRNLDCAVIEALHLQRRNAKYPPFKTVRAAFFEGGRLYENAGFAAKNHIQVAVRDHRCIVGYFRPIDEKGKPISFR
jgi:hypothetical protein